MVDMRVLIFFLIGMIFISGCISQQSEVKESLTTKEPKIAISFIKEGNIYIKDLDSGKEVKLTNIDEILVPEWTLYCPLNDVTSLLICSKLSSASQSKYVRKNGSVLNFVDSPLFARPGLTQD